ncbi:MAG TPA: hypothetical protein VMV65_00425 [Alphaproteobacteria bacterium]|nr:hypothetical protein [Alphaproteobacteria bacterium]
MNAATLLGSLLLAAVASHIPTWAFDEFNGEGARTPAAVVRHYLTFAEGGLGNDKAVQDCRHSGACSSVYYFDPSLVYDSPLCPYAAYREFLAQAAENWFVHLPGRDDAAGRVQGTYVQSCKGARVPVHVYAANQTNPAVRAFFAEYLRKNADDFDFYEMDDTSDTLLTQFYGPGGGFCKLRGGNGYCTQTAEMAADADLVGAHMALANALNHSNGSPMYFYYNGLSFTARSPVIPPLLGNGSRFRGVICENCVVNDGALRPAMYGKVLGAMARIDTIAGAAFVELSTGKSPDGSPAQVAQRLVTTAVAWLGYADGHTIVWPNLEFTTHNLAVWPEDELVPTQPLQTMSDSPAGIAVAPGVWRREFAACYAGGAPIGPCAAVLNGSPAAVRVSAQWFRQHYGHVVTLDGGDAPSGGTISLSRAAFSVGATEIPASQALLLVR